MVYENEKLGQNMLNFRGRLSQKKKRARQARFEKNPQISPITQIALARKNRAKQNFLSRAV